MDFTNDYPISVNATVIEGVSGLYAVQPGAPAALLAAGSFAPGFANAGETFSDVAPGATRFTGADSASNSSSASFSGSVDLSEFVGAGDFSFLESLFQYQSIGYDPGIEVGPIYHYNVFTLVGSEIGGAITVTYDGVLPTAASAPEPSAWALALLGLAALGYAQYRRAAVNRRLQSPRISTFRHARFAQAFEMARVPGYVPGVFARPPGFKAPNGEVRVEGEPGLHRSARLGDLPQAHQASP